MRFLIIIMLLFIINGCKNNSKHNVIDISAIKINTNHLIGAPVVMKIAPNDSVLWISDFVTDPLVYGIHKRTGEVLYKTAMVGNGPSEMTPPVNLFITQNNLCLYDRNKHVLYSTCMDSIGSNSNIALHKSTSFLNNYTLVYNLTDSTYIGTGFFDKRFSISDSKGDELYQAIDLPQYWDGEHKLSDRVRSMYHQTLRYCKHPNSSAFVACMSDILSAYNFGEGKVSEIFEIVLHKYNYSEGEFVSTNKSPDTPIGIKDIACDSKYIYVLYNLDQYSKSNETRQEIRVYDWSGKLLHAITTDVILSIIALDTTENAIYGISQNDSSICKIQLP